MAQMKQGTVLIATKDFSFRKSLTARGRAVAVKTGQRFWKTNTEVETNQTGIVWICREGTGFVSGGWPFDIDQIGEYFEVQGA
jgi:hypothetical protein